MRFNKERIRPSKKLRIKNTTEKSGSAKTLFLLYVTSIINLQKLWQDDSHRIKQLDNIEKNQTPKFLAKPTAQVN